MAFPAERIAPASALGRAQLMARIATNIPKILCRTVNLLTTEMRTSAILRPNVRPVSRHSLYLDAEEAAKGCRVSCAEEWRGSVEFDTGFPVWYGENLPHESP